MQSISLNERNILYYHNNISKTTTVHGDFFCLLLTVQRDLKIKGAAQTKQREHVNVVGLQGKPGSMLVLLLQG